MSQIKVDTITNAAGTGSPSFPNGITNAGALSGFPLSKNFLINSGFAIWQGGTSQTIANGVSSYQPDQWYGKNSLGTTGVLTLSRTTGAVAGSRYGASLQITTAPTSGQTNGCELYQVLENRDS